MGSALCLLWAILDPSIGVGWGTICLSFIWVEVSSVLTLIGTGPLVLRMEGHSYKFSGSALTLCKEGGSYPGWRKRDLSSSTLGKRGAHTHKICTVISGVTASQHCGGCCTSLLPWWWGGCLSFATFGDSKSLGEGGRDG